MSWLVVSSLVGALGLGALGAAVVQGFVNSRTSEAQRKHEATLRELDREHAIHLAELADARSVRDRRSQRIHSNLLALAEVVLRFEDDMALRSDPDNYGETHQGLNEAYRKLIEVRATIVLDAETEPLLRHVNDIVAEHQRFLLALGNWKTTHDSGQPGLAEQAAQEVERSGQRVQDLMVAIVDEARGTLAKAEAPL